MASTSTSTSTARSSHLTSASQSLIISSPATAAFLLSQLPNPPPTKSHLHICPSCSTTLIPGLICTEKKKSKRTRKDRLEGTSAAKEIVCGRCGFRLEIAATTRLKTTRPGNRRGKVSKSAAAAACTGTTGTPTSAPAESKTSVPSTPIATEPSGGLTSKKRTRGKKSSSLQDLLASRKAAAAATKAGGSSRNGFGLGLGDFMK